MGLHLLCRQSVRWLAWGGGCHGLAKTENKIPNTALLYLLMLNVDHKQHFQHRLIVGHEEIQTPTKSKLSNVLQTSPTKVGSLTMVPADASM
ncbi:hypothetical protein HPP92_013663 [Vanilla planifolia]|uniref:Uncharacterized protein n=1 Tax=Vanilla planifolia TaxID=51239 RepID=A0A835UWY0_VANPL|nr:hypothetical protein HPP92_013663 [Vanilla planifolia]